MLGLQKDDRLLEKSRTSLGPQAHSKNLPWFGAEFAQKTQETAGCQDFTGTWGASEVQLDLVPGFYERQSFQWQSHSQLEHY